MGKGGFKSRPTIAVPLGTLSFAQPTLIQLSGICLINEGKQSPKVPMIKIIELESNPIILNSNCYYTGSYDNIR